MVDSSICYVIIVLKLQIFGIAITKKLIKCLFERGTLQNAIESIL